MAAIRKRGTKWEVRVRKNGSPTQTKTFTTKAEATDWASVVESEMARGIFADQRALQGYTFSDLLKRYLQEISPSKKSYENERIRIEAMLRTPLAQTTLSDLSSKRIAEWRDERLKQVTGSTVNRELNLISHTVTIARKEWGIHMDNPVALIRRTPLLRGGNTVIGHIGPGVWGHGNLGIARVRHCK